jgi:secondary thiamine-phosphate synthase enzyme
MVVTEQIELETGGNCEMVNITAELARKVAASGIRNGTVTVFVTGSTAGLTTIEFEPGALSDFKKMWQRLAPDDIPYEHDRAWGDGNGYSHIRASLLGASLTVPFSDKKLLLGTWQQIILVDFDNRPRSRKIVLQISGE